MATLQDTGKFRTNTKDQYYTCASVAKHCVKRIVYLVTNGSTYQWIEPSAGNGVFLKCLPDSYDKVGIDLDPKCADILKGDFLTWQPTTQKPRIFFGNPPFGRQGSLAKKFIQHSATYGTIIAFILPRSFVKPSMSRSFPPLFHCKHTEELGKDAFEVNGKPYSVPCVFQIWIKEATPRELPVPIKEEGFRYMKKEDGFDFACKRVGGQAGKCLIGEKDKFDKEYYYFIQLDAAYKPHLADILEEMNKHVFPSNTTGFRSLTKSEINEILNQILASYF
jgi:hypothetical protein